MFWYHACCHTKCCVRLQWLGPSRRTCSELLSCKILPPTLFGKDDYGRLGGLLHRLGISQQPFDRKICWDLGHVGTQTGMFIVTFMKFMSARPSIPYSRLQTPKIHHSHRSPYHSIANSVLFYSIQFQFQFQYSNSIQLIIHSIIHFPVLVPSF